MRENRSPEVSVATASTMFNLNTQCLILVVSMLDVQSQASNFMFSLSFHTLMVVPSSEAGESSLQAQEGTPLALNWTATIIPSAQHMFHVHNSNFAFQSH